MGKHVKPMWLIKNALYHYSDKVRAESIADEKDEVRLVYVGVDNDDFIGTWQLAEKYKGWIFEDENEAERAVEAYNQDKKTV